MEKPGRSSFRLSRREFLRTLALAGSGVAAYGLSGCTPAPAPQAGPAAPEVGAAQLSEAALRVATIGDPPTLDYHFTTASITHVICWNIYETLLALDQNYAPKPMLADSYEVSPDGLTYIFYLRRDVRFHDDTEMTAKDVVASLKRWGELSPTGRSLFTRVKNLDAKDKYTVVFQLAGRFGSLPAYLAYWGQAAVIMPERVVTKAGKEKVSEFIGTGPYKFVEWKPDVHIKLTRFEGYKPRSEPPDGVAGARIPIIKDVYFLPQPDTSARVTGLLAGDYDFAMNLSADQYATLRNRPDVKTHLLKPYYYPVLVFNQKEPPCDNLTFRQAVAAIFDCRAIMEPLGPQEFWRLDPSFMPFGRWWTDAGKEFYNQNNREKAKRLLQEAGYNGEPLIYMSTRQYDFIDKPSQVASQQMRAAGLNVQLEVLDWATLVARRSKTSGWHFFTTGWTMPNDPSAYPFLSCAGQWPGFYCNPKTDELLEKFQDEVTFEGQYRVWQQIQAQFWSDCQIIKWGDYYGLYAMRRNVEGWNGFQDLFIPNIRKTA
ncbi:MAG: peptide ABC transporter substrate-binding protein [Chloroflexota bacterium]